MFTVSWSSDHFTLMLKTFLMNDQKSGESFSWHFQKYREAVCCIILPVFLKENWNLFCGKQLLL